MVRIVAFTPHEVCRITGLSPRQLRDWDATGLVGPRNREVGQPRLRVYSFRDVVALRTVAQLRERLPFLELKRVAAWLQERYEEPWGTLTFHVTDRKAVFDDLSGKPVGSEPSFSISLADIERESAADAEALLQRTPDQEGRIVRNRHVQRNAWVVDGTRIPTSAVWDLHTSGFDTAAIQREYPRLSSKDIAVAISFERERSARAG